MPDVFDEEAQRAEYLRSGERTAPYQFLGVPDPKPDFDEQTLGGLYPTTAEPAPAPAPVGDAPAAIRRTNATPYMDTPRPTTRPAPHATVTSRAAPSVSAPPPDPEPMGPPAPSTRSQTISSLATRIGATEPEQVEAEPVGPNFGGAASRFVEDMRAANTRTKQDYSAANRLDAVASDMRAQPVRDAQVKAALAESLRRQRETDALVGERDARAKSLLTPKTDALDVARFNAQWKLDHPGEGKPDHFAEMEANKDRRARESLAARERIARMGADNAQAKELRKSVKDELSDSITAVRDMRAAGPGATADIGWSDRALVSLPWGIGEQFVEPGTRGAMAKEQALQAFQTRMETGLAMTLPEREDARRRFGLRVFSDPKQFYEMLDFYENIGNQRVRNRQALFNPDVKAAYAAEGGIVADPVKPAAAPASTPATAPAVGTRKTGKRKVDGAAVTLELGADGKWHEV